jgi:AcrR family transcriptional regulator
MGKDDTARSRDAYHHGDLRNALVDAAVSMVIEKGAEAFSLREAARAVGVSPAAAYRHFADKDALLAAVSFEGFRRVARRMRAAVARKVRAGDVRARAAAAFSAVGEAYVDFAVEQPALFRVMFGPWCALAKGLPEEMSEEDDPYLGLVQTLDALVAAGVIPAERRAGAEMPSWSIVHGFASLLVEEAVELTPAERAASYANIARTLLLGLGCDPALVPAPRKPPPPLQHPHEHKHCTSK